MSVEEDKCKQMKSVEKNQEANVIGNNLLQIDVNLKRRIINHEELSRMDKMRRIETYCKRRTEKCRQA